MLPVLLEVGLHSFSAGETDRYGCITPVFTPPRDSPGTAKKVYGWVVSSSTEPRTEGWSNLIVTDVQLFAPPDFPVTPNDYIDLPDGQYEVIGEPEDYTHGPFAFAPGVVVKLRRVEA